MNQPQPLSDNRPDHLVPVSNVIWRHFPISDRSHKGYRNDMHIAVRSL
ncbi:TPA: hypothetical protein SLO38_000416 [Citrobacter koseri]|nr:hypothetical protein [Citrobacter koseri]HEM8492025.1 hypothetical protein [Citrobacter koseri]